MFSLNDDKRMQAIDSIETYIYIYIYIYATSKYLVNKKEEIKFNNVIKR